MYVSGGSLDYGYLKVEMIVEMFNECIGREKDLDKRRVLEAFQKHLNMVALVLEELEWYFSGDTGEKEYQKALKHIKELL